MKSPCLSIFSLILAVSLYAQEECPCCTETHSQFDFQIGDWMVLDTLGSMEAPLDLKDLLFPLEFS